MGKSILDFTSINGRSGTAFTQVKGRSGTVFWCKPYILTLSSKPTGVDTITCYRYSSVQPGAATGSSAVLTNGSTIYHGDVIYISATKSSGYKDPTVSSSTGTITDSKLTVNGNESITVTAGELDIAPVYITKGTGVSSVFLSTNASATSGYASGSNFNIGSTVYGFAVLQTGYNPGSEWTLVSGSTYRVGSKTVNVDTTQNDFGTVNGSLKSFTMTFSVAGGLGGSWGSSTKTAYYGDTISRSGNTVTCYVGSTSTARWTNTFTNGSATGYTYSVTYSTITSPVSGTQTITATVSRSLNAYTITFSAVNYGSWGSTTKTAYYGDTLSRSGNTVTCKNSSGTQRWTNTFTNGSATGYTYSVSYSSITSPVTGTQTITATASRSLNSYTITFSSTYCSWRRSSKTAYYGDTLSVSGTTVTCKNSSGSQRWTNTATANSTTNQYSYGTPSISNGTGTVTAARTITATSSRSERQYTVSFSNVTGAYWDSTSSITANYSTSIQVSGTWVSVGGSNSRQAYASSTGYTTSTYYSVTGLNYGTGYYSVGTGKTFTPTVNSYNKTYGCRVWFSNSYPYAGQQSKRAVSLYYRAIDGFSLMAVSFRITNHKSGEVKTLTSKNSSYIIAVSGSSEVVYVTIEILYGGNVIATPVSYYAANNLSSSNEYYYYTN